MKKLLYILLFPLCSMAQLPNPDLYSWTQVSAGMGYARDGVVGHYFADSNRLYGGWLSGNSTWKKQYSSIDGATWVTLADASWRAAHFFATFKMADGSRIYKVLGDPYNVVNEATYDRSSWYTTNGRDWTSITSDNGLGDRWGGDLVYESSNSSFYYFGGQIDFTVATGYYNEVWRSTDNCATFTRVNVATPFKGGLLGNSIVKYKGRYIKIGGTTYDNDVNLRIYPREIYECKIIADSMQCRVVGYMPIQMLGRHYQTLVEFDDLLWLVCGYNSWHGNNIQDVWCSDDGVNWIHQTASSMPGRHAQAGWVAPGALFISNGTINSGGGTTDDHVFKMTHN